MTRDSALRELIARAETATKRMDLPANVLTEAGVNARLAWRAIEGDLNSAARLEGADVKAEARARLVRFLRSRLNDATAT